MPPRCLLTALLLLAPSMALAQANPANLVNNASLDEDLAGGVLPAGWNGWSIPGRAILSSVVAGGHTGEKALLVEGDGKYGGVTTTKVPLEKGKCYRARVWVKLEGDPGAKAVVKLDFMRANGDYIGDMGMGEVAAGEDGWQCLSVLGRPADVPGAERVGIVLVLSGKGKVLFDDLELVVLDAWEPGGNLLTNGNMEDAPGSRPAYWFLSTAPGAKVSLGSSGDDPKEGKTSLCLKGKAPYAVAIGERYRVEPGKAYSLSGFVRVKAGQASVKIDYYHDGEYLGCSEALPVSTNAWDERSVATQFEKYPNVTHFAAALVAFGGQTEAYFDDVQLRAK